MYSWNKSWSECVIRLLLGKGTTAWLPKMPWKNARFMHWLFQPWMHSTNEQQKHWVRVGYGRYEISDGWTAWPWTGLMDNYGFRGDLQKTADRFSRIRRWLSQNKWSGWRATSNSSWRSPFYFVWAAEYGGRWCLNSFCRTKLVKSFIRGRKCWE